MTCAIGVKWVGYVLICYGVTDACCSLLSGQVEQWTGRVAQFGLGALVHVSLVITMVVWEPNEDQLPVFFVLAAFWGMGDAIWQTQINGEFHHAKSGFFTHNSYISKPISQITKATLGMFVYYI